MTQDQQAAAADEFIQLVPWGRALLERCEQDGTRLTSMRSVGAGRWLLRTALAPELQEAYGTAPEILVLAAEGEVQGGDLQRARDELHEHEFDLDCDLLVVVDDRPHLAERLDRVCQPEGQWVPWSPRNGVFPPLAENFRRHLPAQDVFERKDAVRGRQVIGRSEVVADLSRRLLGAQAVGVFGLRKIGKTTVVRAVTDRLDPISARLSLSPTRRPEVGADRPAMRVAWLDAGRLYERALDAAAGRLQRALEQRLGAENLLPARSPATQPGLAGLDQLLEVALRSSDLPITVVIDEYDLLFEGSGGQAGIPQLEKLFQLLRAHAQETGALALMVIGRDPAFFEQPEMGGHTNPMLGWFVPRWLGPMPPVEADTLLTKLGRRVALRIGDPTRALARSWTGGHPLLHRQFGSALLRRTRHEHADRAQGPEHISTDPFCNEAVDLFLDRHDVLTICREVFHLLSARYPEAARLLSELCHTERSALAKTFAAPRAWHRPAARILRDFGLVLGPASAPVVPEVFAWYLQTVDQRQRIRA